MRAIVSIRQDILINGKSRGEELLKTFIKTFTGSIVSGVCFYFLYYGVLWGIVLLLDMNHRSVSYDKQLLIEEIGYWVFLCVACSEGIV